MAVLNGPRIAPHPPPRRPAILTVPLVGLLLVLAALDISRADESRTNEYEVKAAFLYNFAKFAEWPSESFADAAAPIVVGVFGEDPFGPALDTMLSSKSAHARPFTVRRIVGAEQAAECHLVFVARTTESATRRVLEAIGTHPVFTVGESPDFLTLGGLINFRVENNRVIFEVSAEQSASSPVRLSSQLLKLSRVVHTQGGRPNG